MAGGRDNQVYMFRIINPQSRPSLLEVATESEEDLQDWMKCIRDCTNRAATQVSLDADVV